MGPNLSSLIRVVATSLMDLSSLLFFFLDKALLEISLKLSASKFLSSSTSCSL